MTKPRHYDYIYYNIGYLLNASEEVIALYRNGYGRIYVDELPIFAIGRQQGHTLAANEYAKNNKGVLVIPTFRKHSLYEYDLSGYDSIILESYAGVRHRAYDIDKFLNTEQVTKNIKRIMILGN